MSIIWTILGLSLLSGMSTPLGGWLVVRFRELSAEILALILGLTAGIMLTVVLADLMPTALKSGTPAHFLIGFGTGWVFLWILRKSMDYIGGLGHYLSNDSSDEFYRMGWFIAIAIALHDLPEGMAIGAGDAVQHDIGIVISIAIALHNIPEGMSIAAPLRLSGVSKSKVFSITFWTGLVTPLGTLISIGLFEISNVFISLSIAFASGAMMYVVSNDILPQSLTQNTKLAFVGSALGVVLMMSIHVFQV